MLVPTATCAKASLTNAYAAALRTLCLLVSGAPVLFARVVVALSFRLDAAGSRTRVVPVFGTGSVCWPRPLFAAHLTNTLLLLAAFTTTAWLASARTVSAPWRKPNGKFQGALAASVLGSITGAIAALGYKLFPSTSITAGYNRTSPVRQTRCCREKDLRVEAQHVRCVFQRPTSRIKKKNCRT
jgi:hypothetical protein